MAKRVPAVKRTCRPLQPRTPVVVVEGDVVEVLSPATTAAARVGHKAIGLASIPSAWTKPFFVVRGTLAPTTKALSIALTTSGISPAAELLVRSSGASELIGSRGAFVSSRCSYERLDEQIANLRAGLAHDTSVHWVVQELVACTAKGQLSNERRVSRDKRDWVAEIEPAFSSPAEIYRIPLRTWRDKRPPLEIPLGCQHRESLVGCLAMVARWTYERLIRVHFEWVWDGKILYVVQADRCDDVAFGVDPHSLVTAVAAADIQAANLEVFRPVSAVDFGTYRKLANAKVYGDFGYGIVSFYVLEDESEIQTIVQHGRCSDALRRDLRLLTTRPLVIRTDGRDTPKHLREMLPRSDELRSAEAAEQWLVRDFRAKVQLHADRGDRLADSHLCLIAHHFIPAAAAAWCQASPDQRRVRIESLWGLPEGLYWYAYDTFDVDTLTPAALAIESRPTPLPFREKCRYKEHFIAPNADGAWVVHRTSARADWSRSITKADWIQEIAWTSRCIAVREGRPVVVMWLIDTAIDSTRHRVLPWYHQEWKQEGPIHKAAPRKKFAGSADVLLQTREDWRSLREKIDAGVPVARIRVDPSEPEMVRDPEFVGQLADVANKHKIVVELSGGILSHAYYMLARAGCDVECVDLDDFAVDDDAIEYNKLVRDGIPRAIASRGESVALLRLSGEALLISLRRKLIEEAFEVLDAKTTEQITEELADVREVSLSIMRELGIAEVNVERVRTQKSKKRGGFKKGLMLTKTAMAAPLGATASDNSDMLPPTAQPPAGMVTKSADLPTTVVEELHVDLRHDSQGVAERQLMTVLPTYANGFIPPRVAFDLATQDGHAHELVVEVQLDRNGADLRLRMRLINAPQQLFLDLE